MTENTERVKALMEVLDRKLTPEELHAACNDLPALLARLGIDRLPVPRAGSCGGYAVERAGLLFGYEVEKLGDEPGKVGYLLHGPKVTYKLMRCMTHPENLYVLNSKGNISSIKGNYRFSDRDGTLKAIYY